MVFNFIKHIKNNRKQNEIDAHRILEECKSLADIINTTTDEKEFYSSYNNLIHNFEELISYKGLVSFTSDPSDDLDKIIKNKPYAIESFKKRTDISLINITDVDPYFIDAAKIVAEKDKASIGMIQRNFKVGFNRAERIMNQLEQAGIVGPEKGTYPRDVLINRCVLDKKLQSAIITESDDKRFRNDYESYMTLEKDFDNMEGHEFEYYCADILKSNGFSNVEVTQGSGDHGIDILAEKDGITYAIQCKCYSSNIGNAAVQQAHSGKSIYKRDIAVVLTNQYFTSQAKEDASELGVKLWDRDKLNEMIKNINKGGD